MDEPSSSDDFKTEISPTEFVDTESVFRLEGEGCVKNEIVQDGEQIWKKDLNSLLELTNHEGKIKTEIEEYDEKPHYDQLENVIVDTFDGSAAGPSGCDKDDIAAHCSVKQECDYEMTEELEIKNDSDIEGMISEDSSQSCSDDTEGEASLQSEGMLNSARHLGEETHLEEGTVAKVNNKEREIVDCNLFKHSETECSQMKVISYKCPYCDFKIHRERLIEIHIDRIHNDKKKYICVECDFSTHNENSLEKHVKLTHLKEQNENREKIYKCSLCDYTTKRKCHLPRHTNSVHLKVKEVQQFKCPYCEFISARGTYLRKHINGVHCGEKKYKCSECKFSSAWAISLERHVEAKHLRIVSTGQKEIQCCLCDYSATIHGNLVRHMAAKHLKVKKYKCSYCDYDTTRGHYLRKHIEGNHSKEKMYDCKVCNFSTAWKHSLRKHVETRHSKDEREMIDNEPEDQQNMNDFDPKGQQNITNYDSSDQQNMINHVMFVSFGDQ